MQVYQVGGAVRDRLLGRPVRDRDWVVVGADPEAMERQGYRRVGRDFPVFLHPETREQYALARRSDGGLAFGPDVTLEEDLRARDLTVNAVAMDAEGQIIDPTGGVPDLRAGLLRHVSDAFADDPLRVLRVARFAAELGFRVVPGTLELMRRLAAGRKLDHLVAERVWQELQSALATEQPRAFFETLRQCGALARVLPEVDALYGVPQPARYHPEVDTGEHVMLALEQAVRLGADGPTRFAVLVHDLGKALTPSEGWPSHLRHESLGARAVGDVARRLRIPSGHRSLAEAVARHHTLCHRAMELRPATVVKLLEQLDAVRRPGRLEHFLVACEADARGRTGLENRPYPQVHWLRHAAEVVRAVPPPSAVDDTRGEEIAAALNRARVTAVEAALPVRDRLREAPPSPPSPWPSTGGRGDA